VHDEPLNLLLESPEEESAAARRRDAQAISLFLHMVVIVLLILEPKIFPDLPQATVEQRPSVKGPIIYLAEMPAESPPPAPLKPPVMPPKAIMDKLAMRPSEPALPPPATPAPQPAPEAKSKGPETTAQQLPAAPVPSSEGLKLGDLTPKENPKLPLAELGAPGRGLEDTMRSIAKDRSAGGGVTFDPGPGRFDPKQPAQLGGAQILSDTQGVDFSPYLQRMLFTIRRNWYIAMPEMARIGKRGRVVLQFEVLKAGNVSRIWLVSGSQSDPLDRAALASISASNPFPPLPEEFKGPHIRLQIMFLYNIPLDER